VAGTTGLAAERNRMASLGLVAPPTPGARLPLQP